MTRTTTPQRQVLLNLANGRPVYTGLHSSPTSRRRVIYALAVKGLIDGKCKITAAGLQAVNMPVPETDLKAV